jgi:hypothetical protein
MTNEPKWNEVYAAFFKPLSESTVATWEYELTTGPQKIRSFSDETLKEALRRLSRKKDREGRTITATLDDVKASMFEIMRERRDAATKKASESTDCPTCRNSGFFSDVPLLYRDDGSDTIVGCCSDHNACIGDMCDNKTQGTRCYEVAVPCTCAIGQAAYRTGKYQNYGAIKILQGMMKRELDRRAAE